MGDPAELEGVPGPGDVVDGKYRVERVLGVGGMGAVVAATHVALNQRVAVKFLLAKVAENGKNVARFLREAQAAALIKSDHVAKVSDVGKCADGTPYMVMEYLDGEDLAERIGRAGAVPQAQAVSWLLQAGEALAEAHKMGIVHRDLKPANLFLAKRPDGGERVKLLDFGISKVTGGKGPALTRTSALMGSPLYMAPEQMKSAKYVDARSDIWALGCILFESLSGIPPFVGETLPEICSKILTEPPTAIRQLLPALQSDVEAILARCLEKQPERRYQTVAELAYALAPFGGAEAQRSAETIARVMGVSTAELAAAMAPATTSGAYAQPPQLQQAHAQTAHAPPPYAQPAPPPHAPSAQARPPAQAQPPHAVAAQPQLASQPHVTQPQSPAQAHTAPGYAHRPAAQPHLTPAQPQPAVGQHLAPGPAALKGASTAAPVETSGPRPSGSRSWLWAVAAVLLLGGGGAAALLTGSSENDDETSPAAAAPARPSADTPAVARPSVAQVTIEPPAAAASASSTASAALTEPPRPAATAKPPPIRRPPNVHVLPPLPPAPPVRPPQPPPGGVRPGDDLFNTRNP